MWRYSYNAEKFAVLVFIERNNNNGRIRDVFFRNVVICESSNYAHFVVDCDLFLSTCKAVEDACIKLRGT